MIVLGDGGYCGTGYITLTKMAHQLLTLMSFGKEW